MEAGMRPQVVYGDIAKIATKGGNLEKARTRVYQFKADVAAADLEFGRTVELHHELRRMLVIASKRHRRADISVFKEALDALEGAAGSAEWEDPAW